MLEEGKYMIRNKEITVVCYVSFFKVDILLHGKINMQMNINPNSVIQTFSCSKILTANFCNR